MVVDLLDLLSRFYRAVSTGHEKRPGNSGSPVLSHGDQDQTDSHSLSHHESHSIHSMASFQLVKYVLGSNRHGRIIFLGLVDGFHGEVK